MTPIHKICYIDWKGCLSSREWESKETWFLCRDHLWIEQQFNLWEAAQKRKKRRLASIRHSTSKEFDSINVLLLGFSIVTSAFESKNRFRASLVCSLPWNRFCIVRYQFWNDVRQSIKITALYRQDIAGSTLSWLTSPKVQCSNKKRTRNESQNDIIVRSSKLILEYFWRWGWLVWTFSRSEKYKTGTYAKYLDK